MPLNYVELCVSSASEVAQLSLGLFFTYISQEASSTYCILRWFVVWFLTWLLWSQRECLPLYKNHNVIFFPQQLA